MRNVLYKNIDNLKLMELQRDKSFDFIFINPPYNTRFDFLSNQNEQEQSQEYIEYIKKVFENTKRILKDSKAGSILVPSNGMKDCNYKLLLDQLFPFVYEITLERPTRAITKNNIDYLYFCSSNPDYELKPLFELAPKDSYIEKDEIDYYRLIPMTMPERVGHDKAEWMGITPESGKVWRYSLEKRCELFSDNRLVLKNKKWYQKVYWNESKVPVSNIWKNIQTTGFLSDLVLNRLAELFFEENALVFCPFEIDGCFSRFCNNYGINWISAKTNVETVWFDKNFERIPKDAYVIREQIAELKNSIEYSEIVAGPGDINRMKEEMKRLVDDIHSIQETMGLNANTEEDIETVLDKIHKTIIQRNYDYESYQEAAKEWINPYWNKLEIESQSFIPTGILLAEQLGLSSKADMAPVLIEYCKSFERELFMKMFKDYADFVIKNDYEIPSKIEVTDNSALTPEETTVNIFIEFLKFCKKNKNKPDRWKLEIGKMKFILELTLEKDCKHQVINDYKTYLRNSFDDVFFTLGFLENFNNINKLRNDCAHPRLIEQTDITPSTDLIRNKLIAVLKYKKDIKDDSDC
ncbi:MAG: hypothetical protein J5798_13150 [Spirochaetaceae bacterium]|nr:hypothetical protein [Spirochaetaceae bacterium]